MKTGKDILKEHGLEMDEHGRIPVSEISRAGLPAVVACCCCTMSMTILSAMVDEEGYIYCGDCAPVIMDERQSCERCNDTGEVFIPEDMDGAPRTYECNCKK